MLFAAKKWQLASLKNKQRYLCRECGKTTRVGDKREKYGIEQKIKVAKLFTEGVSIRSIERIENIRLFCVSNG